MDNITRESLVSEFGKFIDRCLIASIWEEQRNDPRKCREILLMLCGSDKASSTVTDCRSENPLSSGYVSDSLSSMVTKSELTANTSSLSVRENRAPKKEPARRSAPRQNTDLVPITSKDELLDFLDACFDECSRDYLETKAREIYPLDSPKDLRIDPVEAIDMISSALYNDIESVNIQEYRHTHRLSANGPGRADSEPRLADVSSTSIKDIEQMYAAKGSKSKSSKKRKSKGKKAGRSFAASAYDTAQPSSGGNAWSEIGQELESLCGIFPTLSLGVVRSTYHKFNANIDETVVALSQVVEAQERAAGPPKTGKAILGGRPPASSTPSRSEKETAKLARELESLFPETDRAVLLEVASQSSGLNDAANRLLSNPQPSQSAEAAASGKGKKGQRWRKVDVPLSISRSQDSANTLRGASVGPHDPFERVPLSDLSQSAREWIQGHDVEAEKCRKTAAKYIEKRNEFYRKAVAAYNRRNSKDKFGSGVAHYYSIEGHKYDARARIWNMRAAQATVARMKYKDPNLIDLHGLTRQEAVTLAQEEVNMWYSSNKAQDVRTNGSHHSLHIVTGLGTHSSDGRAQVHPSVFKALKSQGWWVEEGEGFIDVLGVRQGGALTR